MLFSSPIFLFFFLPIVVTFYYVMPTKIKNVYLLIASLLFYFWGQRTFVFVLMLSMIVNYFIVLLIDKYRTKSTNRLQFAILLLGIEFNLAILIFFKYLLFLITNLQPLFHFFNGGWIQAGNITIFAGVSFFTFHGISYIVDVYRGEKLKKNFIDSCLYIALFPQLIAGPIIRYHTIASELTTRKTSLALIAEGIERFIIGLAKKVLIANTIASIVDPIFTKNLNTITFALAWVAVIGYALQIYFDFSGYSDMAIGLGRMLGFHFMENFNYPYISQSVSEFWRRWHMSLSSWFRDYVYIPLGGNRKGNKRTYLNLFIVFMLVGFWHGAQWNFLIWGVWYGVILVLERWKLEKILTKSWRPLRHLYTLSVVLFGWVLFRSPNLHYALRFFAILAGLQKPLPSTEIIYFPLQVQTALLAGFLFSLPLSNIVLVLKSATGSIKNLYAEMLFQGSYSLVKLTLLFILLLLSSLSLANNTYNPFIYFQF